MLKHITTIALIAFSMTLLLSCGSRAITQSHETARFTISMTLDAPAPGQRTIDLLIKDKSGVPAEVDQVVLAPVMREMGMASPEMPAQRIAAGQYRVSGEPFSMTGIWQLDVRIVAQGQEDLTTFQVEIQ